MFFVGATAVNQILFLNHRNRKVVGSKHNVLVHYVDVSAPDPSGPPPCSGIFLSWFDEIDKSSLFCKHRFTTVKSEG